MKLEVELGTDLVVPGQEVAVHVHVREGGPSRALALTISFYEQTRDFTVVPLRVSDIVHRGDLDTGQTVTSTFALPADAWPSFKGSNAELWWEAEVSSDEPGLDTRARRRFEVVAATATTLMEHQGEWRERYGDRRGRPDPDVRPEFNED